MHAWPTNDKGGRFFSNFRYIMWVNLLDCCYSMLSQVLDKLYYTIHSNTGITSPAVNQLMMSEYWSRPTCCSVAETECMVERLVLFMDIFRPRGSGQSGDRSRLETASTAVDLDRLTSVDQSRWRSRPFSCNSLTHKLFAIPKGFFVM